MRVGRARSRIAGCVRPPAGVEASRVKKTSDGPAAASGRDAANVAPNPSGSPTIAW